MMNHGRIPMRVVHHSRHDPRDRAGGVEAFARRLGAVFEDVEFTWSGHPGIAALARDRAIVICDNDTALDWPSRLPLIAFQHGVAWQKLWVTRTLTDARLALRQWHAARRARTVWVACARWIADAFGTQHAGAPQHVIYHHVDPHEFDGRLDNTGSRLVLHDARTRHKGAQLVELLAAALPSWQFAQLACAPGQVADRLRTAAAFVHLSRYEGNSIVCTEAMAMNLPCVFANVGLVRDVAAGHVQLDVGLVDARRVHASPQHAIAEVGRLLDIMHVHPPSPRRFVEAYATVAIARSRWRRVLADYAARIGLRVDLGCDTAPLPAGLSSMGA